MALVGRWNLQDATTSSGQPTKAEQGADGIFEGTITPLPNDGPGGIYQRSIESDGTTGRVNAGVHSTVDSDYSLCIWVKESGAGAPVTDDSAGVMARGTDLSSANVWYFSGTTTGAFHASGGQAAQFTDSRGLEWTHYVLTFSNAAFTLYRDGVFQVTKPHNLGTQPLSEPWYIGSYNALISPTPAHDYLSAPIAGAAIFDHPLTPTEVQSEFSRGRPTFKTGPKISGDYIIGSEVTAAFEPDMLTDTSTYEWLRNGTPIGVQTASYILTSADLGKDIQVRIKLTSADMKRETVATSVPARPSTFNAEYQAGTKDGDTLRRIQGNWQVTRDTPIYVDDMQGVDFEEQFENALLRLKDYHGAKIVNFPDGGVRIKQGLLLADPATPASSSQLMHQVVFRGGRNTRLFWDESVTDAEQLIMLDIPAAYQMRLENISLRSSYPNGTKIDNKIGIYHHSAWDWNTNTARGSVFESLVIADFNTGLYVGSPAGPDITLVNWNNCLWTQCKTGVVVEGANVAGYVFDNCQIGTSKQDGVGWRLMYAVPKYFDGDANKPQYLDVWGNPVALDWTDTIARPTGSEEWNKRITDSAGRDRNNSSFDASTASSIGGGPDIAIRNCNTTMGDTTQNAAQYAIVSESAPVDVDNLRVEGVHSAVLKTNSVHSNLDPLSTSQNFHLSRFRIVMREINCVGDKVPYDLAGSSDKLAGFPVEIIGGYYNNDYLPAPARLPRKLITWTGDIRGPVGLTAADPDLQLSYQMDGPTGAVTTLTDSSSYNHDLTVMGSGGELVAGISGQGNAFDLKGTAYAELDAASAAPALNERQKGTVSLRFKINSLATTDDQFAGLLSRRIAENDDGWALTLDGYNDSLRIRHDSGTTFITLPENEQLQVGQWYHLTLVMLGDGNVTFWLDGNKLNTVAWSFPVSANSIPLQIGVDGAYLNTRRFNGLIDDIRIYGEPLSTLRIQELIS